MREQIRKYALLPIVATGVVILDQLTKLLVLRQMSVHQSIPVIPGFFNLTRIHNPGGAFGFMASQTPGIRVLLFIGISLLAAGFILYLYGNTPRQYAWLLAALAMIFGGAVGNLIDRIRFGAVVDFLDFYLSDLHWPAFNIADSAISIGMAVLVFHILFKKVPL